MRKIPTATRRFQYLIPAPHQNESITADLGEIQILGSTHVPMGEANYLSSNMYLA